MAKEILGTSRVTLFPLLHLWPDTYGVAAYASYGHFGTSAVVGYIPIPEVPDISFMDVAARHVSGAMSAVNWVLCTGWSSRTVPKPDSLVLEDVQWHLQVDTRGDAEGDKGSGFMYGHSELYTGRFTLIDGVEEVEEVVNGAASKARRLIVNEPLMKQAREVLPLPR
ncbi:hypothetical protein OTB20_08690 [Streptomyces sp. H27-H1]|uniref:hypothetical protein n=1 Tax=Streptomyces sp. H27-H1 TaxID=2996461 RepID=UPI0022706D77|nr:hypothetical protein [Streptomyces sp. H27-H1]MCY0926283.1 hypothetical protein [Streptomyces sp. H27-H1]